MAETSIFYWLSGTPLILIIAYITIKYLDFKTSNTKPKHLPNQYKINKVIIISFITIFIIYFLSYPAYFIYINHNFKNIIAWSKKDDEITFISHNPILKSKTFKIEIEKPDYYILNDNDAKIIKLEKYDLNSIKKVTIINTPIDLIIVS